jgi:probable HAF family extracellular repeat protein
MTISKRIAMWASAILILVPLAAAQQYNVTDLGEFQGGGVSQGQAINTIGQVAGYARFSNYNAHGFLWSESTGLVDLGSFPPASNFSVAQGIDSFGNVVGYSDHSDSLNQRGVLWSKGKLIDLGTLPGGTSSLANGINDAGQITGYSNGTAGVHAVIWKKQGGIRDLGALSGGYSQGLAINLQGEVAGFSMTENGTSHGVLWSKPSGILALPMLSASDTSASANGLNNLGQVVGGSGGIAVLWQNNKEHTAVSLGALSGGWSSAFAINDGGQVVGWSGGAAFLWTQAQGIQDLNTLISSGSGWDLQMATAINVKGQITGVGFLNGQQHAFVLTPVSK